MSTLDAFMRSLGLSYTVDFVPFSKSRNATRKEVSLNWRVSIGRSGRTIVTDYMQGIGHLPGRVRERTSDAVTYERQAAETGRYSLGGPYGNAWPTRKLVAPTLADVLEALVSDASALDAGDFEEWATEFGYDPDSRRAERLYQQSLGIGLQLRAMLGDAAISQLRDLFNNPEDAEAA